MGQITARLPQELLAHLDEAAGRLKTTRAQVVRQAIEYYLDDLEDLHLALERLQDPADAVLDWADVKRELLDQDQG
ncbi:MAG: ribbon-helix-helix protein, CopG family [Acidobacteriota bacterium]|jgi:transposase